MITPKTAPPIPTKRTRRILSCASVSRAVLRPSLAAMWSIVLPKSVPHTSDTTWPYAAAVSVDKPSARPSVESIKSPAWIITTLSMKPNPTMGIAQLTACRMSWSRAGGLNVSSRTQTWRCQRRNGDPTRCLQASVRPCSALVVTPARRSADTLLNMWEEALPALPAALAPIELRRLGFRRSFLGSFLNLKQDIKREKGVL
eukprot:scaffold256_cov121-Isochrysis_galbana.AAC.9